MLLSLRRTIHLRCGDYAASIAPDAGARITSLVRHHASGVRRLLVEPEGDAFDEHDWPKAGAFPMLPFANRIRSGGFHFRDVRVSPSAGPAGFALHGSAHRRPWTIVEASRERVLMQYVHAHASEDWPWSWSAQEDVQLFAHGLTVRLRVRNDSARAMPLAMGFHPYHPLGDDASPADLHFEAAARRELDAEGQASRKEQDARFGLHRGETAGYSGWKGQLALRQRGGGVIVAGAEGASSLVLHRPASGDYLCVEPVTSLPGELGQGEAILAPGHARTMSWTCAWREGG